MLISIVASGLAIGATYVLIAITYNIMFTTSKVISFTAGQLGMLGGVFGSLFILHFGIQPILGFILMIFACAGFGILTEIIGVRPVLKSIDKHLYVLTTLAISLMVEQVVAIEWGTEPRPFPRLFPSSASSFIDEKYWLPVIACIILVLGLEFMFRRTLIGHAYVAISEDNLAARALGLPEKSLRVSSYALAGAIGGISGFASGELLLAFFGNGDTLTFYGFIPVALGGIGNNRGAVITGLILGIIQQAANYEFGGVFASVVVFVIFITTIILLPQGIFGAAKSRRV